MNLYPHYADAATRTRSEVDSQLGTTTYEEYLHRYCAQYPLDYISFDSYCWGWNNAPATLFEDLRAVGNACAGTGRDMVAVLQANRFSERGNVGVELTANMYRFQAFCALAFGARSICWACWTEGFWKADCIVRTDGTRTVQFDRLKAENEELKKQMDEMLDEVQSAKALRSENDELRRMLEVKKEHLDYKFETADIVGREDGNYMTVFTLGRGQNNGIDRDMPIIASNSGLIGRITDAGATWSKACSIIDTGSSVGAFDERSRAAGIVVGDYELGLKGYCRLAYLQSDADIEVGDRILTSGVGSVYPRGLIIGTVTEVIYDESLRTKYATVKPYAEISGLSSVTVVTSFERYIED